MSKGKAKCPHCDRRFHDENAVWQHCKFTHKIRLPHPKDDDNREPSLAEIAVEAELKRASGERLDPLEKGLLS